MSAKRQNSGNDSGNNTTGASLLLMGIVIAVCMDAVAGTALVFGRLDMMGDFYTTPDEFAWLDCAYTAAKLAGFMMTPALFAGALPLRVLQAVVIGMTVSCALMPCTIELHWLILWRIVQGVAGGIMLVGCQSMLFQIFPDERQALIQAVFALTAVVAPATFAFSLQGWMVDALSWHGIFIAAAVCGLPALAIFAAIPPDILPSSGVRRKDLPGFLLFLFAAVCLTYIAQQGSRWNWFDDERITLVTLAGFASLLAFVIRQAACRPALLIDTTVFRNTDFCFGIAASVAAGIVLFGSTWIIPNFALNVSGFTATEAGMLLLPGGFMFSAVLFFSAFLIGKCHVPVMGTIPLGLVLMLTSMWMLSGSTGDSGSADMAAALLMRASGAGFLFLALTLFTLSALKGALNTQGVALFAVQRQLGGLLGLALLQRYLDHQNALNRTVLASHIPEGGAALVERMRDLQTLLQNRGMEAGDAAQGAMAILRKSMESQIGALSYDETFLAIIIIVFMCVPLLVSFKIWLGRLGKRAEVHLNNGD
jgi:DHA2 family multidrug resistance protein